MDANSETLQFCLGSHSQWQVESAGRLLIDEDFSSEYLSHTYSTALQKPKIF